MRSGIKPFFWSGGIAIPMVAVEELSRVCTKSYMGWLKFAVC